MSLTTRIRRLSAPLGESLILLALAVGVAVSLVVRAFVDDEPWALALILLALAPFLLRRRQPLAALLLALMADAILPADNGLILPALVVLYTIARNQQWRIAALSGGIVALVASVAQIASGQQVKAHGAPAVVTSIVAQCGAAVALGLYTGARYKVLEGLRERADRLARERELLTAQAITAERLRIARELHDVVAHSVSLMIVQAQALSATAGDESVTASTDAIADLGRSAMSEMNRTLKLLRADETEAPQLSPQPSLADLDDLLEQSRAAGLEVELTVAGDARPLSQSADLSAFRIIQEALTNVIKHAAGARVTIIVSYRPFELGLEIINSGTGISLDPTGNGTAGHGVTGMRERATVFGGTLTAEPRPDQGFAVTATLPYTTPAV
jgi:MYXO-CTERM domain-containing protein